MTALTPAVIAELRRLLAAATPGPWHNQDAWWKIHPRHNSERIVTFDQQDQDASGPHCPAQRLVIFATLDIRHVTHFAERLTRCT